MSRGVRGAIVAEANSKEAILRNTQELLREMMRANGFRKDDVACAFFTTTRDLNADFPAAGARQMGWTDVPLLCAHEMDVPGALGNCIRVMLVINTDKKQSDITHIYLKEARRLRPDNHQPK
ncbi:MAG: chorismate mutase [Chloroflexi bacterium]|nr:chorismate mutase [Chloroflexota bacterium]